MRKPPEVTRNCTREFPFMVSFSFSTTSARELALITMCVCLSADEQVDVGLVVSAVDMSMGNSAKVAAGAPRNFAAGGLRALDFVGFARAHGKTTCDVLRTNVTLSGPLMELRTPGEPDVPPKPPVRTPAVRRRPVSVPPRALVPRYVAWRARLRCAPWARSPSLDISLARSASSDLGTRERAVVDALRVVTAADRAETFRDGRPDDPEGGRGPVTGCRRLLRARGDASCDEALEETPARRGSWRWEVGCLEGVRS